MRPLIDLLPDPLLSPAHHGRRSSASRRRAQAPATQARVPEATAAARARLAPLLRAAAHLDPDSSVEVAALRTSARVVTSRLAESGRLPAALVIGEHDPAVVVVRTLAAAWQALTPAGQAAVRAGKVGVASR